MGNDNSKLEEEKEEAWKQRNDARSDRDQACKERDDAQNALRHANETIASQKEEIGIMVSEFILFHSLFVGINFYGNDVIVFEILKCMRKISKNS